jgi:hypothetical protein
MLDRGYRGRPEALSDARNVARDGAVALRGRDVCMASRTQLRERLTHESPDPV